MADARTVADLHTTHCATQGATVIAVEVHGHKDPRPANPSSGATPAAPPAGLMWAFAAQTRDLSAPGSCNQLFQALSFESTL